MARIIIVVTEIREHYVPAMLVIFFIKKVITVNPSNLQKVSLMKNFKNAKEVTDIEIFRMAENMYNSMKKSYFFVWDESEAFQNGFYQAWKKLTAQDYFRQTVKEKKKSSNENKMENS